MRHLFRLGLLCSLLLSPLVWAKPAVAPTLLPPDAEQAIALLPPPPTDDSIAGRADLETLLQVQADRTPAQEQRAKLVAKHHPFDAGVRVFGSWFTTENLPRTAAWFEVIRKQSGVVMLHAKEKWERPRPYQRDPRIHPCVSLPKESSYPSGHSAHAAVWAAIFSAAFPERKAEFDAFARDTMWCRELAGVHYPTDTQAGYVLGSELGRLMLTMPATQEAVAEIRAEVKAYLAAHPAP